MAEERQSTEEERDLVAEPREPGAAAVAEAPEPSEEDAPQLDPEA